MKRIINVLVIALIGLTFSACGYNPPESSSFQGESNAPASEEAQAKQPSVNQ